MNLLSVPATPSRTLLALRAGVAAALLIPVLSNPARADGPIPIGPFNGPLDAARFSRIVSSSADAVPGLLIPFTSVHLAGVQNGTTAFVGGYTDPTSGEDRSGLYSRGSDGLIRTFVDPSTLTPDGETSHEIVGNGEYIDNQITFAAETSAGQKLYRVGDDKSLTTLVSAGDSVDSASPIASFTARGIAGDSHGYAFSGQLDDGTEAVYQSIGPAPASSMLVTDDKARSPVPETGLYIDFPEVAYRSGLTALIGTAVDPDQPDAEPESVGILYASPGNPTRLAAFKSGAIIGSPDPDFRFKLFENVRLFDHPTIGRTLAFTGGFDEEGSDERFMGVFTIDGNGDPKNWINSDMPLPGLREEVDSFTGFGFDGNNFAAGLMDVEGGTYLYAEIDGELRYVLSSYDELDGKPLSALILAADGMEGATLRFTAEFADGSSGVYAVTIPEPATMAAVVSVTPLLLRRRRR